MVWPAGNSSEHCIHRNAASWYPSSSQMRPVSLAQLTTTPSWMSALATATYASCSVSQGGDTSPVRMPGRFYAAFPLSHRASSKAIDLANSVRALRALDEGPELQGAHISFVVDDILESKLASSSYALMYALAPLIIVLIPR